jgi:hypothetical protein
MNLVDEVSPLSSRVMCDANSGCWLWTGTIAKKFGISDQAVYLIKTGKNWAHLGLLKKDA